MSKLSTSTISAIRKAKSDGMSLSEISRTYRCSKSTASSYCRDLFSYPTRKNKSGLCVNCLYLERTKTAHPKQRIKAQNNKDRTIKYHKNLDRNYHPSKCPKSPSGYHHWLIDNMGIGTCIYCKTRKDMNYESTYFNSKGI